MIFKNMNQKEKNMERLLKILMDFGKTGLRTLMLA